MSGSKPGEYRGGRKKGTPNKLTSGIRERLEAHGCDPFEVLAKIAKGDLPCGVCHGSGRTKYQPKRGKQAGERICESCWGSGKDRISPAERCKAASELAQYCEPKRKAVEHSGPGGGGVPINLKVQFVTPGSGQ